MLTTRPPQPAPGPGLLASLGAWTWLGTDPHGTGLAYLLLTHPPGRSARDSPDALEARMRHLAASLGGLAAPHDPVPDLGARLHILGTTTVLLRYHGARFGTRLPVLSDWTRHVQRQCQAIVVVGLNPLPRSAGLERVDTYLDASLASGRLLFGLVRPLGPHHTRPVHCPCLSGQRERVKARELRPRPCADTGRTKWRWMVIALKLPGDRAPRWCRRSRPFRW